MEVIAARRTAEARGGSSLLLGSAAHLSVCARIYCWLQILQPG